jgi:cytochrome c oxidase assembly protein subunit 15
VILQGLLGGITVLFFLPTLVSVFHAVLAQTFFVLTIVMAYGFSRERYFRERSMESQGKQSFFRAVVFLTVLVYGQLIMGALMRHTGSGLAIPDFPTMAGSFLPTFNQQMLTWINAWRFDHHLDPVTLSQVVIHLSHRLGALLVLVFSFFLTATTRKAADKKFFYGAVFINFLVLTQAGLGIFTLWSERQLYITSLHVLTGAALLGLCVLTALRAAPLGFVTPAKAGVQNQKI